MKQKYPNLMKPIRIGNVVLKNRIIAAPTGMMDLTPDGRLTPYDMNYYELKARGGAAVVTLGESITDTATGESHNRQIHLDDPNTLPGLSHMATVIQRGGALANIELSHGGKYGGLVSIGGDVVNAKTSYGPSEADLPSGEHVHEMTKEMIYHIIESFGKAAALCKRAGFNMVMIHAGHGWLFNQFLSPLENKRTDEFGGSLENRARLLTLTLDCVRKAVGPGFPIELRLNGDDMVPGAVTREMYIELAQLLEDKIDLINVSCGSHDGEDLFVRTHPSMFLEHGCNVYLAEGIKKVVKIPVSCVGGIHTPELAEEIIASGKADIVELGRALIADPYFPKKAMLGEAEDITPCNRCYTCLDSLVVRNVVQCSVNPVIGFEMDHKYYQPTADRAKRILVIGGGPAGMEAAITAAKKGHEVILCEKTDSLGGALKFAENVPFKEDLHKFAKCLEKRIYKEKIEVRLNTPVTKEYIEEIQPEVLIVAVGGTPIIPKIKGVDSKNVILATEAEKDIYELGKNVVILGGGLIGCETGINLGMHGKSVTIIEMREELAPEANQFHKMALRMELEKYVKPLVNTRAMEITESGVICLKANNKEQLVEADSVILAVGVRPNTEGLEEFSGLAREFYMVGDCVKAGQVTQAVQQGYYTAREI
jgi:2,4-dienoyl-CoA reductase-like NADH-dependent reductase (Old Yellow Enzyme family)/thioredoxin reductase